MERGLTKKAFDELLKKLDPDRENAARKYEDIRGKVHKLFVSRGCGHPDECTIKTFDRVANQVVNGKQIKAENPIRYFNGVARRILLEYWRENKRDVQDLKELKEYLLSMESQGDGETEELRELARQKGKCQRMCLQSLSKKDLDLLTRYLSSNKKEKEEIAHQQSETSNALRIKIHRIRKDLRECYKKCLARKRGEI